MTFQKAKLMGNPDETLSYNVWKNERVMYLQAATLIPCPGFPGLAFPAGKGDGPIRSFPRWRHV